MVDPKKITSCLVISYGPVPTSEYQTVEGGGMRAWGLATGLLAAGVNDVTVAVNNSFPQKLSEWQGVKLTNWSTDQKLIDLMNSFDAVLVSFCMGSDSVFIADHIHPDVQLILDVYVPIYVEVSARDSENADNEYVNYMADIQRFNHVLKRGDYFLCASKPQKIFYTGVLGSLGIINPRSYRENRILIVPFGMHDEPVVATRDPYREQVGLQKNDFVVLWFGGLYPWFKVDDLLKAIKKLSSNKTVKFVIVGGKNPFNNQPDFVRQYDYATSYAKKEGLLDKSLFFVDWVDFDDRLNWFVHADLIISINNPGEENSFSWRTRVVDFVWGETPILTNGEDVLSEELLNNGAAIRLNKLSDTAIASAIQRLTTKPAELQAATKSLQTIKKRYFWHEVVKPLAAVLQTGLRPSIDERAYRRKLPGFNDDHAQPVNNNYRHLVKARLRLVKKAVVHSRKHGLGSTVQLVKQKVNRRLPSKPEPGKTSRKFVFISHPIDNTGAPLILLQIIDEAIEKYGATNVKLVAPHIEPQHLRRLRSLGVGIEQAAADNSDRVIQAQLQLHQDDFVLMNTLAVFPNYKRYIFNALETGQLTHAGWFIHEHHSQIAPMKSELADADFVTRASSLINDKKLRVFVPSERVRKEYDKILKTKLVQTVSYQVDVPDKYKVARKVNDYNSLDFLLVGSAVDGRKGQFIAISAFYAFMKDHYQKNPGAYRDFKLQFIAIGQDFVSQQVKSLGTNLLGKKHLAIHPPMSRTEVLDITATCNAVICCSLNETFAIYVGEGMHMGHVILRNDSAGADEQLREGVNGYSIDESDVYQFAGVIEKLLNKKTTSNKDLQAMGKASQEIIAPFADNDYLAKIDT